MDLFTASVLFLYQHLLQVLLTCRPMSYLNVSSPCSALLLLALQGSIFHQYVHGTTLLYTT